MTTADDVARYILDRRAMTAMKMQKLVYYSQAWHLARIGASLFDEPIEAWVNGPVVRELYDRHRGQFSLSDWPSGDPDALAACQRDLVDEILGTYGEQSADWLSQLTHSEEPWRRAREGLPDTARSSAIIDPVVMECYYRTQEENGRGPEAIAIKP
jgi:uncharacterized phage-associated protein